MPDRVCRHPLRIVPHLPQWLACDTCRADFLHREDCPSVGGPDCARRCMGGADVDPLLLLWIQPAYERTDHA
jgi:hypothetical protein